MTFSARDRWIVAKNAPLICLHFQSLEMYIWLVGAPALRILFQSGRSHFFLFPSAKMRERPHDCCCCCRRRFMIETYFFFQDGNSLGKEPRIEREIATDCLPYTTKQCKLKTKSVPADRFSSPRLTRGQLEHKRLLPRTSAEMLSSSPTRSRQNGTL